MMNDTPRKLQEAYKLIREQRFYEARELLNPITQLEPENADAWWLLANAQTEPAAARDALRIVLKLRPGHKPALDRMAQLERPFPGNPDTPFGDVPSAIPGAGPSIGSSSMSRNSPSLEDLLNSPGGLSAASVEYNFPVGDPAPIPVRKRSPLLTVLLILAGLFVCACLACGGLLLVGGASILGNPTFAAAIGTVNSLFNMPEMLPTEARAMGALSADEAKRGSIAEGEFHVYSYRALAGEKIVIRNRLQAQGSRASTQFGLYDATGQRLKSATLLDFVRTAANATGTPDPTNFGILDYTFSTDGMYSILVQQRGEGLIEYEIVVERQ